MARNAEGSFLYGFPYGQVFEEAQNALLDRKFKIEGLDKTSGFIKADTGSSIFAYGFNMEVMILEIEGGTKVDAYCKIKVAKLEWGKCWKELDKFFAALNARLTGSSQD